MRRRQFCSLLGAAALAPLHGLSVRAEGDEACPDPLVRDDGWGAATPDDALVDRRALCGLGDRIASAPAARIHGLVVARKGALVFERYFRGQEEVPGRLYGHRMADMAFGPDTLHAMKSVSTSVASLVLGIAVDRGLIRSLDVPVLDFFPELADLRSPERDRILLVHALTMTMGLPWEEATAATGDFANDEARMNMAWDPNRQVLGRAPVAPAGREFLYSTGALRLVSAVVHRATGRPLDDFAREALFDPLGIQADWARVRGETDAGGGLRLRPRDMAEIGQLVLSRGRWKGRQIVSEAWIEASTTAKVAATDGHSYGYLWWLGRTRERGREAAWIGALGRGGQFIRIVPDRDLVVAVTAGYYQDYSPEAFRTQFGVFRDVLRAVPPPG